MFNREARANCSGVKGRNQSFIKALWSAVSRGSRVAWCGSRSHGELPRMFPSLSGGMIRGDNSGVDETTSVKSRSSALRSATPREDRCLPKRCFQPLAFHFMFFPPAASLLVFAPHYLAYRTLMTVIASIIKPPKEEASRVTFRVFRETVTRDELTLVDAFSFGYFLFHRVSEVTSGQQHSRKVRPEEIRLSKQCRGRTSSIVSEAQSVQARRFYQRIYSHVDHSSSFFRHTGWRMSQCT